MTHATVLTHSRAATPWPAAFKPSRQTRTFSGWFLILVLAGLGASAAAVADENVTFYLQPADSTVVAGHEITFCVETDLYPPWFGSYQWYRNGVAIPGATKQVYRFTARDADHGARYHVVASGYCQQNFSLGYALGGPTPSRQATLTVLAAGSTLTPKITAPNDGTTLIYAVDTSGDPTRCTPVVCRATGNNLTWAYRFDDDETGEWRLMPQITIGSQAVRLDYTPTTTNSSALTVRVTDDVGVAVTRTWQLKAGPYGGEEVLFSAGPSDATVVAGHQVAFFAYTNIDPAASPAPSYQWYRNDVAISGATANPYRFVAQVGDNGARYHVVASGASKLGPLLTSASPKAMLTVQPAGSNLSPVIVAPEGDTIYRPAGSFPTGFRALGNNLKWSYRYYNDTAGTWRALDATSTGTQYVQITISPSYDPSTLPPAISVRVVDDAGVAVTRTWALGNNSKPRITAVKVVGPNPVRFPGPTTLSVDATDNEKDPLSYHWFVDYENSVPLGDAVFTPSGATCSVTFTKFGHYYIIAAVSDGKPFGVAYMSSAKIVVEPNFDVRADVNQDGEINGLDHGIVSDNFGQILP